MFKFILKLLYIEAGFYLPNNDNIEDQIIDKLLTAFDDDMTIENWMESRNIKDLCGYDLFKSIIKKVRDVLSVINTKRYSNLKSLIMETHMNLSKIGYPFYETSNIIESLQRIFTICDIQRTSRSEEYIMLNFFENILYKEYDRLYYDLECTIIEVGFEYSHTETLDSFMNWMGKRCGQIIKTVNITRNLPPTTNLMKMANDLLESILPVNNETPVYVEANFRGFEKSIKYFSDRTHCFDRKKSTMICPHDILHYSMKCSQDQSIPNRININDYIWKRFLCNRTTVKILVILFHYYSEIKGRNLIYEVIQKGDNEYEITCLHTEIPAIKDIKQYWMQQETPNLLRRKIIHKFGLIVDYDVQYSTEKSDDTEEQPIETRLILLSCGHQLGFELIDEFLKYYYAKYDEPLKCHICRHPISIVGSYNAVVYRCK